MTDNSGSPQPYYSGSTPNPEPKTSPWADRKEKHLNIRVWMWRIFYGFVAFFLLSLITFSFLTPSFKRLEDPSLNLASEVVAADDSTVLGRLYVENRAPVRFENIPKHLVKALMATEDARFTSHSGIDPEALGRVIFRTFLMGQSGQGGGSTISMQTAKLLFSDRDLKNKNFIQKTFLLYYYKLSEMITAVKLERAYTKEEIITMYLNTYDFGYNAHGIRAAAEVYFSKAPEQLTVEESATLVGMCQNSSLFNPIKRNEKTRLRRNKVLERCFEQNVINEKQYREMVNKPLDVSKFKNRTHNDGLATYFRMSLANEVRKLLKEKGILKPDGSTYDVYRDGLEIHTTLDPEMQRLAEESMREHMRTLQAKYFKVWRGRDPWTYRDSETGDDQIRERLAILDAQIRQTNRYQLMRSRFLDGVLTDIETELDTVDVMDSDIINMLRQEKQPTLFETMQKNRSLSANKVAIYRNIMTNENWSTLKKQWSSLQTMVKAEFAKRVPMKVFAYNAMGEKDTVMSPLDSLRYHRMHLQLGSMGIDPTNGHIKFWVGGTGHKYFQVDHVNIDRQVGSTFKPFVYATAIAEFGISPCTQVHDVAQTIGVNDGFGLAQSWTPKNSGGYSGGYMTLWEALKESRNTASVYLVKQIGSVQPIREIVMNMGVNADARYPNGQFRLPKNPAICLGAADLTVMEMTGAYSTFANNGTYYRPMFITKITDKAGRILYQGLPKKGEALRRNAAYVMLQMLKYNVRSAPGIKTLKSEVGGKTGTTNDYRDGWFMGVTPKLVVGTWVGGEDQWIRFLRIEDGQGSAMARPFFSKVMEKIEKSKTLNFDTQVRFKKPDGDLGITINCGDYYQSGSSTAPVDGLNTEGGAPAPVNPNAFQDEEGGNLKPSNQLTPSPTATTPPAKPATATPAKPAPPKPQPVPNSKPPVVVPKSIPPKSGNEFDE